MTSDSSSQTQNWQGGLSAQDEITGKQIYLKASTDGRLIVDAELEVGDIEIGAVEIKNGTDDTRLTVQTKGSVNVIPTALVDASGNQITSFGGGTQYAELATTAPGTGTLAIGRYKLAAPTLTDGQLYGLQLDASGNLKVSGSLSVGGTTDNSAFTAGTTTGTPAMGFYHSTIDTVTDGRAAAVGITSKRAMLVNLQTAAGVETGVAAAPLQVSLANTGTNATAVSENLAQVAGGTVSTTGVTGQQKVGIADSLGQAVSAFPATFLRTTDEPHQLFYDPFDTAIDTTNRWTSTVGGTGVAAANTSGVMAMGTGTTNTSFSKLNSQPTFTLPIPAWLGVSDAIALPDGAAPTANSYRYWGTGTTPGSPTVATPVTDGYGFELNTDGKLRAVVYSAGTRTVIQDLSTSGNSTQPLDASYHRYIIYIRTDKAYWYIDGITSAQLVATSNFQSAAVQSLPRLFLCVAGAAITNTQIQCTGATVWDTGKNNTQISDATFPWRKQTVKAASTAAAAADLPAVVALHPTSPLPTGSNTIGALTANQSVNISQMNSVAVTMGNGGSGTGVQRVSIASDSTGNIATIGTSVTPGTAAANLGKAEDAVSGDGDVGVGTLGVRKAAPANTSNADGDYEFLQLSAGRQWVWAQPNVVTISTSITRPNDSNAYAANDAFSNSTSAPTAGGYSLSGAALVSAGTGIITDCIITASGGTAYVGEIWVFDQAVTAINDNAAFTITDGEAQTLVGIIPFQTSDVTAANSVSYITGLNIGYTCVGTANLRFLVKIMSAVTPAAQEVLSVRVKVTN